MPAPLQIVLDTLDTEEDRTLSELRVAPEDSQQTRDGDHMLRLNSKGENGLLHKVASKQKSFD
jgi:hypothetical protein